MEELKLQVEELKLLSDELMLNPWSGVLMLKLASGKEVSVISLGEATAGRTEVAVRVQGCVLLVVAGMDR